jgi:elongation factor Ts
MQIKRVAKLTGQVGSYVHFNGQSGTLLSMSAPCADTVKADVCMHITAIRPKYVRREEIPAAEIAAEKTKLTAEAPTDKPPQVIEKIVSGKLDRWFSEFVLLEQAFVKDDKKTVQQMLTGVAPGLTVERFVRYEVGGT